MTVALLIRGTVGKMRDGFFNKDEDVKVGDHVYFVRTCSKRGESAWTKDPNKACIFNNPIPCKSRITEESSWIGYRSGERVYNTTIIDMEIVKGKVSVIDVLSEEEYEKYKNVSLAKTVRNRIKRTRRCLKNIKENDHLYHYSKTRGEVIKEYERRLSTDLMWLDKHGMEE